MSRPPLRSCRRCTRAVCATSATSTTLRRHHCTHGRSCLPTALNPLVPECIPCQVTYHLPPHPGCVRPPAR